jgi:hypothetical protein
MLSREHVVRALEAKRDAFSTYDYNSGRDTARYLEALDKLAGMSVAQVEAAFGDNPRPGARPTAERVAGRSVVRPFAPAWANHAEARAWALEVLRDVTTVAVDGSRSPAATTFSARGRGTGGLVRKSPPSRGPLRQGYPLRGAGAGRSRPDPGGARARGSAPSPIWRSTFGVSSWNARC